MDLHGVFSFCLTAVCVLLVFSKRLLLCVIVKWLFYYSRFIDWFFTCLDLYGVSFYLNCFSQYVIRSFTRNDYFVCLWNDYYLISSSLFDSVLAWMCMLILFNLNKYRKYVSAVITSCDFFVCLWSYYSLIFSSLIYFLMAYICITFFIWINADGGCFYKKWLFYMIFK